MSDSGPLDDTEHRGRRRGLIRVCAAWTSACYRALGLLVCVSVVSFVAALVLHHLSSLPSRYTWLEPLRTVRVVFEIPYFPTAMALTYLLALFARRGAWDIAAWTQRLAQHVSTSQQAKRSALVRTVVAVALLVADTALFPAHTYLDHLALLLLGWFVGGWRAQAKEVWRISGQVIVSFLVFTAVCYCFTVLKALLLMDRDPLDQRILNIEHALLGCYPHQVIARWVAARPRLLALCDWVYFRFFHHMILTTVLLTVMKLRRERWEYLGSLALCYFFGGPLYHAWPGVGPLYFDAPSFQHLWSHPLTANRIRGWLFNNTRGVVLRRARLLQTWGYIACMPSLHMAQEFVMLYYARRPFTALTLSSAFTGITLLSVVALGWHYPLDALGGAILAAGAIAVARWQRDHLLPAALGDPPDAPLLPTRGVLRALWRAVRAGR